MRSALHGHEHGQYELYVACVTPDYVHLLFEPQIKEETEKGESVFWSLPEILHGIKSSSAHRINKQRETAGPVWEKESFDRLIRSETDLQEKFLYICQNPWDSNVVVPNEDYPWLWTQERSSAGAPKRAREARELPGEETQAEGEDSESDRSSRGNASPEGETNESCQRSAAVPGSARASRAVSGVSPETSEDADRPNEAQQIQPLHLSGLEPLNITRDFGFAVIGERTNITGSPKFSKLILGGDFEDAVTIARQQVANGANIIDVNVDEGMLDSEATMTRFLNLVSSEPEIARVPFMIDSSKWSVIEAGLKCAQGKSVVNSISLKNGEEEFLRQAQLVRRYGAAVIVMAFDERGQADNLGRRIEICRRAYDLLRQRLDFPASDIIFDPNVLTVATGLEEHRNYAVDFIEATRSIKENLPGARVSGGISNISFSFRGNNAVREAMHAAFLYHAIRAGLDMGIVNAGQLAVYEEIEPELRERVEDVLLNRRDDATERLVDFAERVKTKGKAPVKDEAWRAEPVEERLKHALVKGIVDYIDVDTEEARQKSKRPLDEMEREGFDLPLLIGGATTSRAHTAVKIAPHYRSSTVHVIDASRAVGVINSLLNEELKSNFDAQTRNEYARLREEHAGRRREKKLLTLEEARANQTRIDWSGYEPPRPEFTGVRAVCPSIVDLRDYIDWSPFFHVWELRGRYPAILDDPVIGKQARELFDDAQNLLDQMTVKNLLTARGVYAFWPASSVGDDVDLYVDETRREKFMTFYFLRQQMQKATGQWNLCLADYVAPSSDPQSTDYLGGFAVSIHGADELAKEFTAAHDDYSAILAKALADRLAEAFAEYLHKQARIAWGFGRDEKLSHVDLIREKYRGIRPAAGYPACPDHAEKRTLFDLLSAEKKAGIRLTESYAMHPGASVSGLYISHPDAKYFSIGQITRDQVVDYAMRRREQITAIEKRLAPNLAYET